MKKSLLALAVLGAFAGAASAQSSVTVYGKIDMGLGKPIGLDDKQVRDAAGSRIGFRGVEDLGGGLAAVFGFEHRFAPDTGNSASATFWNGYSNVGLRTQFGVVTLGRHYTASFTEVQNQIDPFGGDTVAALRGVGMLVQPDLGAGLGQVRVSDSIRYDVVMGGFKLAATFAEATQVGGSGTVGGTGPDRPFSIAGSYTAGPLFLGLAYENPQFDGDKLVNFGVRYTIGPATLRAGYTDGTAPTGGSPLANGQKLRSWLLGASIRIGAGDLNVGYAEAENRTNGNTIGERFGIGYHYNLSKRTKLYVDYGHEGVSSVTNGTRTISLTANGQEKDGYDFGIQHNF